MNNNILTFDHTNAATFTVPISGNGLILKANSAGDTTLANVAAFTGTVVAQAGLMTLQGTANAAGGYLANNNGTLRFSGGTVNLGSASIQADANGTVEYSGSTVRGGYLLGRGTNTISGLPATMTPMPRKLLTVPILFKMELLATQLQNGGTITSNAASVLMQAQMPRAASSMSRNAQSYDVRKAAW